MQAHKHIRACETANNHSLILARIRTHMDIHAHTHTYMHGEELRDGINEIDVDGKKIVHYNYF